MPPLQESCGSVFVHAVRIADDNEITEPHRPLDDTQAHPPVTPPPVEPPPGPPPAPPTGPPGPPPDGMPPPPPDREIWPWLAAFGILVVVGLLLWLFVFRDTSKGKIVPAVVGMQQQQAVEEITREGFAVQVVVAPSSKSAGIVFSQK